MAATVFAGLGESTIQRYLHAAAKSSAVHRERERERERRTEKVILPFDSRFDLAEKISKKSKSDRRELLQSDESEGEENTRAESVQKVLRYAKEIERCLRARVRASA